MTMSRSTPLIVAALLCACAGHRAHRTGGTPACIGDAGQLGPPSQLSVTAGPVAADVEGIVILRGTDGPLAGAAIWMDTTASEPAESAADGRFVFRGVRPGRHVIVMRRIGVQGLRDSINVPVAGQLRIEAQPVAFDGGCDSFGEVTVAKP